VEVAAQATVEGAEQRLLEIAAVFDEPAVPEPYPLALLPLGHRSRTLLQGFLELQAGAAPAAGRALLPPMLEINTLVRFLRKNPDLHTELWQAEGDRNTVAMVEEIRSSPELRARLGEEPLDDAELEARRAKVDESRRRAHEAGLPGGGVLPSVRGQLQVINEAAADIAYTTAYRTASWDIHAGPRAFLVGTFTTHNDRTVSYEEKLSPEQLLPTRALAVGIVASTVELIASELHLAIEHEAYEIVRTVTEIPPDAHRSGE
jgi:hypothetical protein